LNETVRRLWARIQPLWQRLTPGQRRNLLIALGAAVLCVVVAAVWLSRPHYVTVMSGLDAQSLGEADAKLKDLKIPDEIEGSSILVPASQADEARIQLAMAGLPKSGYIGYDSIPNNLWMTQDQFNIQVLDVLQRSLAQTIESIDGVEQAQVHIVMPSEQLFVSEPQDTAKASVFLQLAPGTQLSPAQVAGIQQLVAHSVKGLTADNVTVVDQRGVTLSGASDGAAGSVTGNSELTIRQQLEQELTNELTAGLNQIVGPGNAVVVVHANVTFDQVQTKSHTVQPVPGQKTGLPVTSQETRKQSNSNGGSAGGVAGQASTNPGLPTYAGTTGAGGNSYSSETDTNVTYDNSYVDSTRVADPIQIQGYTVGVLLNANDPNITPAVIDQVRSFVQSAVGAKAPGANDITVSAVPFQTGLTNTTWQIPRWWWWLAAAGAGALALSLGAWWLWRRRRAAADAPPEPVQVSPPAPAETPPDRREQTLQERLAELAKKNPDEFAGLLRMWLHDSDS
jgi:flagellar M-ring protein FliF